MQKQRAGGSNGSDNPDQRPGPRAEPVPACLSDQPPLTTGWIRGGPHGGPHPIPRLE